MIYYVCYNQSENKFYSKLYGWVSYELADYYTAYECRTSEPPSGGIWIKADCIKDGVVFL